MDKPLGGSGMNGCRQHGGDKQSVRLGLARQGPVSRQEKISERKPRKMTRNMKCTRQIVSMLPVHNGVTILE